MLMLSSCLPLMSRNSIIIFVKRVFDTQTACDGELVLTKYIMHLDGPSGS